MSHKAALSRIYNNKPPHPVDAELLFWGGKI